MPSSRAILIAAVLAALSPMFAVADAPPPGRTVINAVFSDQERDTIRRYFQMHPDQLQTLGAKGGGADSTGVIVLGAQLPSGILQQARPLPQGLERALPPAPRGYARVILFGKVLLVDVGAQVVHDEI